MNTRNSALDFRKSLIFLVALAAPWAAFAQTQAATSPDGISMTPKNGQSTDQQAADRSACQQWAKGQTGYDATQSGGGVPSNEFWSRRDQYGRAMSACLEARGYTVHVAPPATAPVPAPGYAPPVYAAVPAYGRYGPAPAPTLGYRPFKFQIDAGYSITAGNTSSNFDDGVTAGVGVTFFPIPSLPVGLRADGSYSWFDARNNLLFATNASYGYEELYGGDADLQINLGTHTSHAQLYLFGGAGWYRERTTLHQVSLVNGTFCGFYYCAPGQFFAVTGTATVTSPWRDSWNAGLGWEVALANYGSFFVEARYLQLMPNNFKQQFVPIRVGFRF
jgi:hypothetical protein